MGDKVQWGIGATLMTAESGVGFGIGTDSPDYLFHVQGGTNASAQIGAGSVGTGTVGASLVLTGRPGATTVPTLYFDTGTDGQTFAIENDGGTLKWWSGGSSGWNNAMYLTAAGDLYVDEAYHQFSPKLPDIQGYKWLDFIKENAFKPCKPDSLAMEDMTEEEVKKYDKPIGTIVLANARLLDYLVTIQKQLQGQINDLRLQRT